MGHIRLGTLPRTRQWIQVLDLIGGRAGMPDVAAATMDASQRGLLRAAKDPGLVYTVWLLTQVPLAARSKNFRRTPAQARAGSFRFPKLAGSGGGLHGRGGCPPAPYRWTYRPRRDGPDGGVGVACGAWNAGERQPVRDDRCRRAADNQKLVRHTNVCTVWGSGRSPRQW